MTDINNLIFNTGLIWDKNSVIKKSAITELKGPDVGFQ